MYVYQLLCRVRKAEEDKRSEVQKLNSVVFNLESSVTSCKNQLSEKENEL